MSSRISEPVWLTETQLRMLHAETLSVFGGPSGVRDRGMLQSALGRPRDRWAYQAEATLFDLAAAYGFAIAKNRGFIDGNKRAAVLAVRTFLFRNGHRFSPDQVEMVMTMEGVAGGTVDEAMLSDWIREHSAPR